jgi:hypothetical protein
VPPSPPPRTVNPLDFVKEDPLLGGVDLWESSLIFRQETNSDKFGIDFVALSYVWYKDGERPPSATWIVPEGARYDDSGAATRLIVANPFANGLED